MKRYKSTYKIDDEVFMTPDHLKTTPVTSATRGIEAAFSRRFAGQTYDLAMTDHREKKVRAMADKLSSRHNMGIQAILSEPKDRKTMDAVVRGRSPLQSIIHRTMMRMVPKR